MDSESVISKAAEASQPPGLTELFTGFLHIGLVGFGGVLPVAHRMIVEERRWLTNETFVELLALCQFLPGGNIINLSVAIGMEFHGIRGAVTSLLGLIAAPTVVVIALGMVYDHFQNDPRLQHMFAGLAAAAAGMLVATAWKMIMPMRRRMVSLFIVGMLLGAIAILRLPLLPTMAIMAPLSILLVWRFPA